MSMLIDFDNSLPNLRKSISQIPDTMKIEVRLMTLPQGFKSTYHRNFQQRQLIAWTGLDGSRRTGISRLN